jgi:hypothetical protein
MEDFEKSVEKHKEDLDDNSLLELDTTNKHTPLLNEDPMCE